MQKQIKTQTRVYQHLSVLLNAGWHPNASRFRGMGIFPSCSPNSSMHTNYHTPIPPTANPQQISPGQIWIRLIHPIYAIKTPSRLQGVPKRIYQLPMTSKRHAKHLFAGRNTQHQSVEKTLISLFYLTFHFLWNSAITCTKPNSIDYTLLVKPHLLIGTSEHTFTCQI